MGDEEASRNDPEFISLRSYMLMGFANSPASKEFIDGFDKVGGARRRLDPSAEDHFIRNIFAVKGVGVCCVLMDNVSV
jgi:hypothetical protein